MRRALVPDGLPERPGLEIASCFLPANEDVGGDFFVVSARGDATVFVLGDVVGRGLDAAMRASYVRTVFTSITRFEQDPGRVLSLTNEALMGDQGRGHRLHHRRVPHLRPARELRVLGARRPPAADPARRRP